MVAVKEILETIASVLLSIAGLFAGLYLLLLFFDWWLKFKSGQREQEGLSNLLISAYKDQPSGAPPEDEGQAESPEPRD